MSLESLLSLDLRRAWLTAALLQYILDTACVLLVEKYSYCCIFLVDTATWIAWYKAGSVGAEWRKKERAHTGQHSVAVRRDIEK